MSAQKTPMRCRRRGFTLIEVMIAVAVIAIIAAIAYPSYVDYVRKAKRAAAKSALLDTAARQERYFFKNKSYTDNLTTTPDFGYASDPAFVDRDGAIVGAGDAAGIYEIEVSGPSTDCPIDTCFALTATAINDQANDSDCTSFTLKSDGEKGPSGCW